ncbi:hypothetical protein CC80DRAFT_507442 [Byssothecium circinans]|uniref:Uncharacterized protein n=1 Tax=Byssothecium circinans TaxID=147558 RepID=A0A6A5TNI7_9PLEO|nr:hypothetical protein CC80DRAFT_507442 [Byssothecium circinans]
MLPLLNAARLYNIRKALKYYQYKADVEDLKPNDFKWLLKFVRALLNFRELRVSIDTLKKEVSTFIRKRKASSKINGGEVKLNEDSKDKGGRSKRVKGGFNNDRGSLKRSRGEDSKDKGVQ